ncbi:MAG: hypothetical protein AAF560_23265 [Acidobacteriota bacterium]
MTFTFELSAEQAKALEEATAQRNAAAVRGVLMQAIDGIVSKLLDRPQQLEPAAFDALLESLASDFADAPALSDDPEKGTTPF